MSEPAAFPIFVFEGNDLSLFDSFESVATGLEGIDVEDGVYQAYDSQGREVNLEAHGVRRGRFVVEVGKVVIGGVDELPDEERFEEKLRAYLQACEEAPPQGATLEEVVRACINRAR